MLEKKDHIEYWIKIADDDWDTAVYNLQGKRNLAALFFFHLTIEKLIKAIWVKDNFSNTPTFTHDLQKLISETSLELDGKFYDYLSIVNSWNIEARYPDYKQSLHRIATPDYMQFHFDKVKSLKEWLQSKI